jgi:UDP-N-acetylmuramoyl-tripeptide--D-alanyl-D-alanine ligase
MKNKIVNWWLTPKFPQKHIDNLFLYNPTGIKNKIRNYYRTWIVHPLKRRFSKVYLQFLQSCCNLKVISITGSSGKTTTKEMLASILSLEGETVYSYANIDPVYNIPTTILRCTPKTKYLILEFGVEYPNEMDFYLWLAKPNVGIITNIYPTHTKFLHDVNGVCKEKSKLVRKMDSKSVAVLNFENLYLRKLNKKLESKIIWFGKESANFASNIKINSDFSTQFILNYGLKKAKILIPIAGEQFVSDALAAISAAFALSVNVNNIKKGLRSFNECDHRMSIKKLKSGAILIDDSYNNNPESAKMAIRTLKEISKDKKSVLVFGDMLELGKDEIKYHKEVAAVAKVNNIDHVVSVGNLSKIIANKRSNVFSNWEKALPKVKELSKEKVAILIKGSRGMQLDKIVDKLN